MVLEQSDEHHIISRIEKSNSGYIDSLYHNTFFARLDKLREDGCFYDVTLLCKGTKFPTHKIVLAAASKYFHAMFAGGMKEAEMSVIELMEVDDDALSILIRYAYSGIIDLDATNAQSVLEAANLLEFPTALDFCVKFVVSHLDVWNCLGIFQLGERIGNSYLQGCARHCINKHFKEVCKTGAFKELELDCVKNILENDNLLIDCETEVLDCILEWVLVRNHNRLCYLEELLALARLSYIGPRTLKNYIDTLSKEHSVLLSPLLEEAIPLLADLSLASVPIRTSYAKHVHVMGGETSFLHEVNSTECFEPGNQHWTHQNPLQESKSCFAVALYDSKLFVIAGMKGSSRLGTVEYYDTEQNVWRSSAGLIKCRGDVSAAVFENSLFVAGGSSERTAVCRYVERFDLAMQTWQLHGKMNCHRRKFCMVPHEGRLYAIGGMNDREGGLKSVETLDPSSRHWHSTAALAVPRYDFGAVSLSGNLYVVGGASESMGSMNLVERYNLQTNSWISCSPLLKCRGGLSVAVYCGRIFAIGGIDSYMQVMSTVESYDEIKDEWSIMKSSCLGRSGAAAIVLPFKMPPTPL